MGSNDPVIGFVIVAVIQFTNDRKIGEMNVVASYFEPHPPVRLAIKFVVADKCSMPRARSLERYIGRQNDISGHLVITSRHPDDLALLHGLRDAIPQRFGIVRIAGAAGAKLDRKSAA